MCAARAVAQRRLERTETQLAIERMRAGNHDGRLATHAARVEHSADARQNRESIHLLRHRLCSLRERILATNARQDSAAVVKAMNEAAARLEATLDPETSNWTGTPEEYDAAKASVDGLRQQASLLAIDTQPMCCIVCFEGFSGADCITGKNCYHWYHPTCIAQAAFAKVKPTDQFVVDNNPYWVFDRYDGGRVLYKLKPEFVAEDGSVKGFPLNTWVDCPECREPYADSKYFSMATQALATIDEEEALELPLTAQEQLSKWREEGHVLLVNPPGVDGIVMAITAKPEGVGATRVEGFPHEMGKTAGVFRQCGFTWDKTGEQCGGGRAFYREQRFDDQPSDLALIPGALTKTQGQPRYEWVVTTETEMLPIDRQVKKRQKVWSEGGSWKFEYPAPVAEEVPASAAAASV
jgi:hypothetical protein